MKIKKLFKNIAIQAIKGSRELEVKGISSHSKVTAPGDLFIAKKGNIVEGGQFIAEAIGAGAVAVVTDIYNPFFPQITQIIHPDPAQIEGEIAATFYDFPSNKMTMIGITGTSGKTTTASLTHYLLEKRKGPTGLIGTVGYRIGSHHYEATKTTPEAPINHKFLHDMVNYGCRYGVMEVTSHALMQKRVSHIHFNIAIFTNLTPEHLDYHGTMEEYARAKEKLFLSLNESDLAIVNRDDPWHSTMIENCPSRILTFGITSPADVMAENISLFSDKTEFDLVFEKKWIRCHIPLTGRYNVYNALAAAAAALSVGISLESIAEDLSDAPSVAGRLEPVSNGLGIHIFVDFAHKPDALSNVLQTLNEIKQGRIITVFGCGGDRDRLKRPKMGAISAKYSDLTIVTSDNPRSEDPQTIADEIIAGFEKGANFLVELNRAAAIDLAIRGAQPNDIVLIAGKGHEKYQIFARHTYEFDDRRVAEEACRRYQFVAE